MVTKNITRKIMRIWENLKNKYKHTKTKSVKDWLIVHIIGYIMHSTALIKKQEQASGNHATSLPFYNLSTSFIFSCCWEQKRQKVPFPFLFCAKNARIVFISFWLQPGNSSSSHIFSLNDLIFFTPPLHSPESICLPK